MNIGMVFELPIVGIPLPLMSYGGTSLMTFMTLLGGWRQHGRNRKYVFPLAAKTRHLMAPEEQWFCHK